MTVKIYFFSYVQAILFAIGPHAFGQHKGGTMEKPAIDTGVFGKWPTISSTAISDDGQYSLYVVSDNLNTNNTHTVALHIVGNKTLNSDRSGNDEVILNGNISSPIFANDSRKVYFLNGN